jgi:hypothetical protein
MILNSAPFTGSYSYDITKRWQAGFYAQHNNTSTTPAPTTKPPPITQFFTGNLRTVEVLRLAPGLQNNTEILAYGGYTEYNGRNDEHGLTRGGYFYGRLAGNNGRGSSFFCLRLDGGGAGWASLHSSGQ